MRGYFGIGVEGVTKAMNAGGLFRAAHAFDASFVFFIGGAYARREAANADTSDAPGEIPLYESRFTSFPTPSRFSCRAIAASSASNFWTAPRRSPASAIRATPPMFWAASAAACRRRFLRFATTRSKFRQGFVSTWRLRAPWSCTTGS
jgi:hypothetical protein